MLLCSLVNWIWKKWIAEPFSYVAGEHADVWQCVEHCEAMKLTDAVVKLKACA